MSIFKLKDKEEKDSQITNIFSSNNTSGYDNDFLELVENLQELRENISILSNDVKILADIVSRFAPGDIEVRANIEALLSRNINVRPWGVREIQRIDGFDKEI